MPRVNASTVRQRLIEQVPQAAGLHVASLLGDVVDRDPAKLTATTIGNLSEPFRTRARDLIERDGHYFGVQWMQLMALQKVLLTIEPSDGDTNGDAVVKEAFALADCTNTPADDFVASMTQMAFLSYTEQIPQLMARYWEIFVLEAADPALLQDESFLSLESEFEDAFGLPLTPFVCVAFGIVLKGVENWNKKATDKDWQSPQLDVEAMFAPTKIDPSHLARAIELLATNMDEAQAWARAGWRKKGPPRDYWYDFGLMRQKPLLRLDERRVHRFSTRLAAERVTSGLFHYYANADTDRLQHFRTYFGRMYERYVQRCFQRMQGMLADAQLDGDQTYGSPVKRAPDVLWVEGGILCVLEVVALRLTEPAITSADAESVRRYVDRIIGKMSQIDERLADLRAGDYTVDGLSWDSFKAVVPVVVTVEQPPLVASPDAERLPMLADVVDERVRSAGLFADERITRAQIIGAVDVEALEALLEAGAATPSEVLVSRALDSDGWRDTMANWMYNNYERVKQNTHMLSCERAMWNAISQELFGQDVEPPDEQDESSPASAD